MAVDATGVRIDTFSGDVTSSASMAGAGELTLRMEAPQQLLVHMSWGCTTGDIGMYYARLSPDKQTLTVTSVRDNCTTRREILTGAWTRWSCPDGASYAYCDHATELAPGRYVSPVFRPFGGGTSGQLAYTVPAGWAKLSQPPTWPGPGVAWAVSLARLEAPTRQAIRIFSNIGPSDAVAVPDAPTLTCSVGSHAPNGNAEQIADFLESLPYLSVSGRTSITINGLAGVQIDVSVVPHSVDPCSSDIELFRVPDQGGAIYLNYEGDAYARLIVLDSPDGREVIEVSAPDAASLAARVAEAMPVIHSFEFIP